VPLQRVRSEVQLVPPIGVLVISDKRSSISTQGGRRPEMSTTDHYNVLVIGSGEAGKYLAWSSRRKDTTPR
jgi:hypothetical protein